MKIKSAKFVMSNSTFKGCPNSPLPEFAFIGRSNVGKSSLINMICGNKKLAKTSSTPGKTQLINHFLINENWHLVDLPGYGYAKVSKKQRAGFYKMISDYMTKRTQLYCVFVLIDCRIKPQAIDIDFINFLGEEGIPFNVIFTKADKPKPREVSQNVEAFNNALLQSWESLPPHFVTSSEKKQGGEELLKYIDQVLSS